MSYTYYIKSWKENDLKALTFCHELIQKCSFVMYLTWNLDDLACKYGDRSYRFMNLTAVHIAPNVHLCGTELNIGIVESGDLKILT